MRVDSCERNMYNNRNTQHGRKSTAANAGLSAHKDKQITSTNVGLQLTRSQAYLSPQANQCPDATKSLDAPDHQKSTAEAANSWAASLHAVRGGNDEAREVHLGSRFEQLRRSLLAASYSQHGADLGSYLPITIATMMVHFLETAWCSAEVLPGVLSDKQLRCIIDLMDRDHNGRVDFTEFASFIASQNKP